MTTLPTTLLDREEMKNEIMKKSMVDKVTEWRRKKILEGGKSLTVWLYPTTVGQLQDLKDYYGRSPRGRNVRLIAKAIQILHKQTFNE